MAKVRQNIVVQGLSGSLGDQLVIKQDRAGRTIVSVKPSFNPNRGFSDSQKSHQVAFREAAAYAQAVQGNPIYVQKAAGTPRSAYNVAMGDWFRAPEILEVDLDEWSGQDGQVIRVKVVDDVQVTTVKVTILDANDAIVEQGTAAQLDGLWWRYITHMPITGSPKVRVSAQDLPRNITEITKTK